MALPALAPLALKAANVVGVASIGSKILPKLKGAIPALGNVGSKARKILPKNVATALGIGGGAAGGYGIASTLDKLGIEDARIQKLTIAGLAVGAIFAVGQLFDFNVDL